MAAALILQSFLPVVGSLYAEYAILPSKFPSWYISSSSIGLFPSAYSLVILFNVVGSSIVLMVLGMKVGKARAQFKDKAVKNGDKDAEERFSYPKLYAEGFTNEAKLFNCVQRGHQQPLETYTQFVVLSLLGGLRFPITVAIAGLLWIFSRFAWAKGYATGEPGKRYDAIISKGVWTSLIAVLLAAGGVAASISNLI